MFMHNLLKIHWKVVNKVFKYLKGSFNYAMVFSKSSHFIFKCLSNSDWEVDKDSRGSTSGYCFYLRGYVISWSSKKQCIHVTSSSEAMYGATFTTTLESI
ncbi:hypothetical protein KP509_35G056400 [Ceratopteris richardii]|uniref:Mitochondrial protein n=1 Tax=Ceratopteris richardii TaxID=49495 RepID=A0A8T2QGJ2_CERRI|nr:hypothetical protein KP509_35G056400 [Ceratopteris richardii]